MSNPKREGALAAHSVVRFVFTVPDLDEAQRFYETFGLDVRKSGDHLDLHTFGHPHCWGQVYANGKPKQLSYLSIGVYPEDLAPLREHVAAQGLKEVEAHPLGSQEGFWLREIGRAHV